MFEDKDVARLKFIMTMSCNFRCDYCFEGGKSNRHLSPEDCIKLGKQVLSEMKQEHLTVLYFGGEPLLRFPDIKLVTQVLSMYAKKVGKKVSFTFISNGTIISEEMIKHFKQYNYYTSISCDGIAEAQNAHRGYLNGQRDSFNRVSSTIDKLLPIDRELCLSMVVTKDTCKYLAESFQWAIDKGIRNFAISPVLDQEKFTPEPEEYLEQLKKIADIADGVEERLVINPPLDNGWSCDNSCRTMTMTDNSYNVELSPIGLNIIPESSKITSVDFATGKRYNKVSASDELRRKIIEAEREASRIYKKGREEH